MQKHQAGKIKPKSIYGELLSYMLPGIAGLLFNSLYIVVDGLFVARMLGRAPLAAVTVGVPVVEILLAISMLISVGAGVLISNENGKGEHKKARHLFNVSFQLLALVALLIAVIALLFIRPLARMLGATPDIIGLVVTYLKYFFIFSPAFMFSYALCTWLRNDSQPKLAMAAQIIGALANIFLDWLFMGPLQMGIAGAALATGLGPKISIGLMLPHFLARRGNLYFEKIKTGFKAELKTAAEILLKGLPSFTMEFALGITTLCVNIALGFYLGALGFATFGILGYIALIVLSIFLGMAEGSQPLISFYHGAAENETIRKILRSSLQIAGFLGLLTYVLLFRYAKIPVSVFADRDLELVRAASSAAIFYFSALFASGINIILASYVQSLGRWKGSVLISLTRSLFSLIPLLLLLPPFLGELGIWLSVPLAEILTLPLSYRICSRESNSIKSLVAAKKKA